MGLFKKEPDLKCWNCDNFISHEKVKWLPRTYKASELVFGEDNLEEKQKVAKEMAEILGDEHTASPNQIFGLQEYEYRGKCPECSSELTCFWRGKKSFNKIQGVLIAPKPKPFLCNNCENRIDRESQIWYSSKFVENDKIVEYLITVCPKCHTEQGYPYEYDLDQGIIE